MQERASEHELWSARDRFRALLESRKTPEKLWQQLFAECPYILSDSLPLRLLPSDIQPLARPGIAEPDFVFFSKESVLPVYGSIEIKRADSPILTLPRKRIITLSRTASTALQQAREYTLHHQPVVSPHDTLFVGGSIYVFVIMGLSEELAAKVTSNILQEQFRHLLPRGCQILPYDTLFKTFERSIPPRILVLVPALHEDEPESVTTNTGGGSFCGL